MNEPSTHPPPMPRTLYSPRLSDDVVRALYREGQRRRQPMTTVADALLRQSLDRLAEGPPLLRVCEDPLPPYGAIDHPDAVTKLAVLDIIPTGEAFGRGGREFGIGYYHWFFLAQPAPLPEHLIGADPDWFWRWHTQRGQGDHVFTPEALEDYLACFRDPETVRAICEDYRAAATVDCEIDESDRRMGRRIACPVLALWGANARLEGWYDTLAVWREWAADVRGRALPGGHYLPEECPDETLAELLAFFGDAPADTTIRDHGAGDRRHGGRRRTDPHEDRT